MQLKTMKRLELPPTADMHVHLRQAELMELVAPTVRQGGVDTVFVMPNILHPSVTPDVIAKAAAAGITGVKMYPQGVTTNSENGVANVEAFYPTFAAMEENDMGMMSFPQFFDWWPRDLSTAVLNLHGEVLESLAPEGTTLEEAFLPTLKKLYERFPRLRIILEHCTTSAAVEAVKACGPTVGATITAHHLYLTGADACCDPFAFCKPIPKKPTDRDALLKALVSGNPKFFFGSDSAPHQMVSKTSAEQGKAPAGVFTQPVATQLVLMALEEGVERGDISEADITQEKLEGFLSRHGRRFYKLPETSDKKIVLERKGEKIGTSVKSADGKSEVGISRAGSEIFSLAWEAV
ncbi:dihydroorotase [Metarhizium acridum CQMa 102]|uniref:Dihydroorotase n=1 Tax=Metarhizium acridum (strain CQMa 102) TaxID=655827 RepID=E9E4H7_METAQ|nr:dihydroorotase [Metarhizium acridum CQMa 102]EFY89188.1 dihydroorotase [Metarhizium acridum CQMa 102]